MVLKQPHEALSVLRVGAEVVLRGWEEFWKWRASGLCVLVSRARRAVAPSNLRSGKRATAGCPLEHFIAAALLPQAWVPDCLTETAGNIMQVPAGHCTSKHDAPYT